VTGDERGIWVAEGFVPPGVVLPDPFTKVGTKGAVRLTRAEAAGLLSRGRLARRRGPARVTREVV
jgi:hypothetical protein